MEVYKQPLGPALLVLVDFTQDYIAHHTATCSDIRFLLKHFLLDNMKFTSAVVAGAAVGLTYANPVAKRAAINDGMLPLTLVTWYNLVC